MAEIKKQPQQQTKTTGSQTTVKTPVTKSAPVKTHVAPPVLFTRENYKWMAIGIAIIALGMILMSGGKSADPNVFNKDQVYSFTRITLAPILIVGGLLLEIFAIFRNPKSTTNSTTDL